MYAYTYSYLPTRIDLLRNLPPVIPVRFCPPTTGCDIPEVAATNVYTVTTHDRSTISDARRDRSLYFALSREGRDVTAGLTIFVAKRDRARYTIRLVARSGFALYKFQFDIYTYIRLVGLIDYFLFGISSPESLNLFLQ